MKTTDIHSAYFIGIGGIGMSALAKYMRSKGIEVAGYDKNPSALTTELEALGIQIHFQEDLDLVPKTPDIVVFTPAVPIDHTELVYYQQGGFNVQKRSQVLADICADGILIAVSGSHGKTTVSTMITHLLHSNGIACTSFLGGMSINYDNNFVQGDDEVFVVEADEFDRSFLRLHPNIAVVTAIDADHLDIYGNKATLEQAFLEFVGQVKPGGQLIRQRNTNVLESTPTTNFTYNSVGSDADAVVKNLRVEEGRFVFDIKLSDEIINDVALASGGRHDVENFLAATMVARSLDIGQAGIVEAASTFRGVSRRFEFHIRNDSIVYIDDYAHHPREIDALINSVRLLYPEKKILAIFQPHLFSRTKDHAVEFGEALAAADRILLLPIYPARELPMAGVSSELILASIPEGKGTTLEKDELISLLTEIEFDIVLTIGAGDIDQYVEAVKTCLQTRTKTS